MSASLEEAALELEDPQMAIFGGCILLMSVFKKNSV